MVIFGISRRHSLPHDVGQHLFPSSHCSPFMHCLRFNKQFRVDRIAFLLEQTKPAYFSVVVAATVVGSISTLVAMVGFACFITGSWHTIPQPSKHWKQNDSSNNRRYSHRKFVTLTPFQNNTPLINTPPPVMLPN